MLRRLGWLAAALVAGLTGWAFAYGPLFPYSIIQPGYASVRFQRAEVMFPRNKVLDAAYQEVDRYIQEAEEFEQLHAPHLVRITLCADWSDFARFCPVVRGRAVAGVTLEPGTVIYITPKVAEKNLDPGEFLRHEIAHAVIIQNMTLWQAAQFKHITWLYEGLPVWFGRQKAYISQQEFLDRAKRTNLVPVMRFDAGAARAETVDMRFAYVAWRDFLDYLVQRSGRPKFLQFFAAVRKHPPQWSDEFQRSYGSPFDAVIGEFARAIREDRYRPLS